MTSLHDIAQTLNGEVIARNQIAFPTLGHSDKDRGTIATFDAHYPDGVLINSINGGDWREERDRVKLAAGIKFDPRKDITTKMSEAPKSFGVNYSALGKGNWEKVWNDAQDWRRSRIEGYLQIRGILHYLPNDFADIRYHKTCPYGSMNRTPCMLTLIRDLKSGRPIGIQRTPIDGKGHKCGDRMIMGSAKGAIMLSDYHDANLSVELGIGEGFETTLSLRKFVNPNLPIWAMISAPNLPNLPVIDVVKRLYIAVDNDDAGRNHSSTVAKIWSSKQPLTEIHFVNSTIGNDLNDQIKSTLCEKA